MRLEHHPADGTDTRTIATEIEFAETRLQQARGLMFRRSIPEEYALVFPFEAASKRDLHMLFVPFSIDAIWLLDGEVTATKRLRPFVGLGRATADTVIELPAGGATGVDPGDRIEFVE